MTESWETHTEIERIKSDARLLAKFLNSNKDQSLSQWLKEIKKCCEAYRFLAEVGFITISTRFKNPKGFPRNSVLFFDHLGFRDYFIGKVASIFSNAFNNYENPEKNAKWDETLGNEIRETFEAIQRSLATNLAFQDMPFKKENVDSLVRQLETNRSYQSIQQIFRFSDKNNF